MFQDGETMLNPWLELPKKKPFILKQDKSLLKEPNSYEIDFTLLPEPFLGMPNAEIMLLNLNPGIHESDIIYHRQPTFQRLNAHNLHHKPTTYPFYLLNPALKECPGYNWWSKKLSHLINKFGQEQVSKKICCVEYFPYHSKRYRFPNSKQLPSQEYSFYLVRKAIKQGTFIIFMRSHSRWRAAVPELKTYHNKSSVKSIQNPYLTPKNLSSSAYKKIEGTLNH